MNAAFACGVIVSSFFWVCVLATTHCLAYRQWTNAALNNNAAHYDAKTGSLEWNKTAIAEASK
jgi:hypothetical protein